ncbi:MAG: hypothetical protein WDN30_14185 [Pararobbsia sp.]
MLGMMHSAAETFGAQDGLPLGLGGCGKARGEKDPYAWTVRAIDEAGSQFGKINRSNIERTYAGRMMLAYKSFTLGWLGLLFRMARKGGVEGARGALVMLATQMAMGGLQGLPFAQNIDDLIDTYREFHGLQHGLRACEAPVGGSAPSGRASARPSCTVWPVRCRSTCRSTLAWRHHPRTNILKAGDIRDKARNVLDVMGPQMQFATRLTDAYDAAAADNMGRAGMAIAPNFIKRPMQGAAMLATGQSTDLQGHKIANTSTFDAVAKIVGGATAETNRQDEMREEVSQAVDTVKDKQAQILNMWARGLVQNDSDAVSKARDALIQWNANNPDTRIVITPQALITQVKSMRLDANTRALLAAPKGSKRMRSVRCATSEIFCMIACGRFARQYKRGIVLKRLLLASFVALLASCTSVSDVTQIGKGHVHGRIGGHGRDIL